MRKTNRFLTILMFMFLYLPMAVLVVASFNTGKNITQFEGFTLQQYVRLFQDDKLLGLLGNSLLIAVLSSLIATVFGTLSAVGINNLSPKMRNFVMGLTNIPMTNPDIVTGVSLSLLFVFVGSNLLGHKESLNFWTLLIAHVTFSLPYVILNVMPKLRQMDSSLTDAAMDLGCTPAQAFFKVTLPEIMPGILAGGIMAFTMSLDDFVISYFVTGTGFITLPVEIYSYTRKPIQPKVYAMFTLLFGLIFILMLTMNLLQIRADKRRTESRARVESKQAKLVKRLVAAVCILALIIGGCSLVFSARQETVTLNVYNWGMNIADGSDDTLDIIAAFQEAYPHIKVNYSTYDSNEALYTKLSNGVTTTTASASHPYWTGTSNWWGAWTSEICCLMSEGMVYGQSPNHSAAMDETMCGQFAAFRLNSNLVYNRQWYWLSDVVSSASFALVGGSGRAVANSASSSLGVRPFALLV